MGAEEEFREHAAEARAPFDKKVAASMAVIAAALAVVSVLGHIATTEELLAQQLASDQWAFYQAKALRRYQSEVARDLLAAMNNDKAQPMVERYAANIEHYEKEGAEVQQKAHEYETERDRKGREALRLHMGEIFLEIAIVFASLAILSKREPIWWVSLISGLLGAAIAFSTVALR